MIAASAAETLQPRPFSSVAAKLLLPYDEAYPGTFRRVLCASPLRRQGVWISLAALRSDASEVYVARLRSLADPAAWEANSTAETIRLLLTKRVKDILCAFFENAEGLLGALSKIGDAPLRDTSYQSLIKLLSEPEHKERAKVVRQLSRLSASRLTVLEKLEAPFLIKDLVEGLSVEGVYEFRRTIDLILKLVPEASPEVLAQSIKQLGQNGSLEKWAERWISKAQDFPVALPRLDEAEFIHLRSGAALKDAALRMKNCLRRQIQDAALGRVAYLEYRPSPVIIRLIPLSQSGCLESVWLADAIFGPSNFRVDAEVAKAIWQKLYTAGIVIPLRYAEAINSDSQFDPFDFDVFDSLPFEDGVGVERLDVIT